MKYPIGIQDFESLIKNGYTYVDKTEMIYSLAHDGRYYFLSRPRRFGKSLLLSTMKAYFLGKKELFKGLAMESLESEWKQYPVLYLDMNSGNYKQSGSLEPVLNFHLAEWEKVYGADPSETTLSTRFAGIIRRAAQKTGESVVVLVDEYDKPLLSTITLPELQDEHRSVLKAFYSVLKTQDAYIKFAFLTGVTKFSHVSIFSDLNNLRDISMNPKYETICGLTEGEIRATFDSEVGELASANGLNKDEGYARLRKMYDGYHFCGNSKEGMYNPFSVLNALSDSNFRSYWFATGTPTFLVELLKDSGAVLSDMTMLPVTEETLSNISDMRANPLPVLYQSGYLTIKSFSKVFQTYTLDYPNEEVERGFLNFILPAFSPVRVEQGAFYIQNFVEEICGGDPEAFMQRLKDFFDSGDYHIVGKMELYFQNAMYVIFKLLGLYVDVESATSRGRIDLTLQTKDYIYLVEIKLDGSAEQALKQIDDKGYARKFAGDPRRLFKIGVNFSSETKGIGEWEVR